VVILDEPSSALDPIAEYNMYHNMLEASKGKTVIFISHRLSSARIADRIYFLEHGKIVESGNHDELMHLSGKYAQMFELQAQNYREGGDEEHE
jgi:ATP-binding cassette subfamily B protein